MKRLAMVLIAVIGIVGAIGLSLQLAKSPKSPTAEASFTPSKVFVGGDIHTLSANDTELIISGHESAAISHDLGKNWKAIKALDGADIMGWTSSSSKTFAGGHSGLYVSAPSNNQFVRTNFFGTVSDVHAVGAAGDYIYLASPQFGILASQDNGKTWLERNTKIGQGFMGSMLVDPANPLRVLAPDMQYGLMDSTDGGKNWRSMGGPSGTMWVAWNPTNNAEIIAIGMAGAGLTKDNGATWTDLAIPKNTAAIAYSADGQTLFAAALDEIPYAHIFTSTNDGGSWSMSSRKKNTAKPLTSNGSSLSGMDPNMPGMDHSTPTYTEGALSQHPLKPVLGVFGLASAIVMTSALLLKRKDEEQRVQKLARINSQKLEK